MHAEENRCGISKQYWQPRQNTLGARGAVWLEDPWRADAHGDDGARIEQGVPEDTG